MKKTAVVLSVLLVLVLGLSSAVWACAKPTPTPAPKPAPAPSPAAPAKPAPAPAPVKPAPAPSPAPKQQEVRLGLWTSPLGTAFYAMGTAAEKIVNGKHPYIRLAATETPGTVSNLQRIGDDPSLWKTTVFGAASPDVIMGERVIEPFKKKTTGAKGLWGIIEYGSALATFNPNIKTLADLKGKKVGLGRITQSNFGLFPSLAIKASGLYDQMDVKFSDPAAAVDAMIDGVVDAAIVGLYFDATKMDKFSTSPEYVKLQGTGKKVYLVGFGKEAIQKLAADGLVGYTEIPAGKLEGVTANLPIYFGTGYWAVHETFPEDLAYQITKTWIENAKVYAEYHKLGEFITPLFARQALTPGAFTESFVHPGALKAYKEAGIVVK